MWCGVVSGEVWCGEVWRCVVWCGVVRRGVVGRGYRKGRSHARIAGGGRKWGMSFFNCHDAINRLLTGP